MVQAWQGCAWWRSYHCSPLPTGRSCSTLLLARRDTVTLPGFSPWASSDFPNTRTGAWWSPTPRVEWSLGLEAEALPGARRFALRSLLARRAWGARAGYVGTHPRAWLICLAPCVLSTWSVKGMRGVPNPLAPG